MRIVMMIAGIVAVLAGALAIAYGGWWIEFSFGLNRERVAQTRGGEDPLRESAHLEVQKRWQRPTPLS